MSHPIQEEDRIATGKIIAVGVISLALFGVGTLWAVSIEHGEYERIGERAAITAAAADRAPEVGLVYQLPFPTNRYGVDKAAEKRRQLEGYGWVDKKAQLVHIPIDRAIERYVRENGGTK